MKEGSPALDSLWKDKRVNIRIAGKAARVSRVEPNEVAEARKKSGLTQREFADVIEQVTVRPAR